MKTLRDRLIPALAIGGGWTLVGLLAAAQGMAVARARGVEPEWSSVFWAPMISVWLWALFTPAVLRLAGALRVDRRRWLAAVLGHLGLGLLLAAADVAFDAVAYPALLGLPTAPLATRFGAELFVNVFSYAGLVAVAHALEYHRMYRESALRMARLESRLAAARLQALRARLHPHFLFNTINAAAELVHSDPDAADRVLVRLGRLLRHAFAGEREDAEIPLRCELEIVEEYLEIAKLRLGDRLSTSLDAPAELHDTLVPELLIQHLVENGIRHGAETTTDAVHLAVAVRRTDGSLRIRVEDDGPGLPAGTEAGTEAGTGGLAVTRGLLRSLYGDAQRLDLFPRGGGGTAAEAVIPVRRR